jgi:type IV secretion system protein VirD4
VAAVDPRLDELRAALRAAGGGRLYVGLGPYGLSFARPEAAALVLGPPRSGKTTALAVPNVLVAPGPVVVTSTKADVLGSTLAARRTLGRCWLLDPSGTVPAPAGVERIRWSPVCSARRWDDAVVAARAMVGAARPGVSGDAAHWTERAEALLAPLLHAAALSGTDMRCVLRWVLRHDLGGPSAILAAHDAELASAVLAGLAATDAREQSGIWSTTAGVLAAYRSEAALEAARAPATADPDRLAGSRDTVYICAPARYQALTAPVVVAFLESVRAGAYRVAAADAAAGLAARPPVTLVLDELANIAPLPDLPAMISEAGGQGVLTLACLQDLSQARQRWGAAADGLLSLFGTKVVLPGIADLRTLELVSRLAGDAEVPTRAVSRNPWWTGRPGGSDTWSLRPRPRLPVDAVNQLPAGTALILDGPNPPATARMVPWCALPPFAPRSELPAPGPAPEPRPGRAGDRGRARTDGIRGP